MKKIFVFLFLFSILFFVSCDDNNTAKTNKDTDLIDTDTAVDPTDTDTDVVPTDTETPDVDEIVDTDPCDPNPCQAENKSICTPSNETYTCSCNDGYVLSGTACVDPATQTGDSCNSAIPLTDSGSVTGTTASSDATYNYEVTDECTDSCESTAKENIYSFTVETTAYFSFSMEGENSYDTLIYLRSSCETASSQLFCNDDSDGAGSAGAISGKVSPGTYYIFADGCTDSGSYTLTYTINPDPCMSNPCGEKDCSASADFSSYTCVCPSGTIEYNGECLADPCEPNPCSEDNKTKCAASADVASYTCSCDNGYTEQDGECVEDDNPAWTIMVYLNADNSLDSDGADDFSEIKAVSASEDVNILVLMDRSSANAKLYKVSGSTATQLADWGELDMSKGTNLEKFGKYAAENYPAKHNMLILWNHGLDWRMARKTRGFSNDDHGSSSGYDDISIASGEFASALDGITTAMDKKFDIVGFDACLMGSWEVAAATEPYSDYLVASEETEPSGGWAYNEWLPTVISNPTTVTPLTVAKKIADTYSSTNEYSATMAVFDLSKVETFGTALSAFATDLSSYSASSIESVRSDLTPFGDSGYGDYIDDARDIYEFANEVKSDIGTSATDLIAAHDDFIVYLKTRNASSSWGYSATDYSNVGGMSIYFPESGGGYDSAYEDDGATWNSFTTWKTFVTSYAN